MVDEQTARRFPYDFPNASRGLLSANAGIAADDNGKVYFIDSRHQSVLKRSRTGEISTLVTFTSQNGEGLALAQPHGIAVDREGIDRGGYIFVSLAGEHTVRMISPTKEVTILAGAAWRSGAADGIGSSARFSSPRGLAVDGAGHVYVADSGNHTIRRIARKNGEVTTVSGSAGVAGRDDGSGGTARFNSPHDLALDPVGNLFVLEPGCIRKIVGRIVTTLLGAPPALVSRTSHIAVDAAGAIYLTGSSHFVAKGIPVVLGDTGSRIGNASVRFARMASRSLVTTVDLRSSARTLLARAVGPGLKPLAPDSEWEADPRLELRDAKGVLMAANDDWGGAQELLNAFARTELLPFPKRVVMPR